MDLSTLVEQLALTADRNQSDPDPVVRSRAHATTSLLQRVAAGVQDDNPSTVHEALAVARREGVVDDEALTTLEVLVFLAREEIRHLRIAARSPDGTPIYLPCSQQAMSAMEAAVARGVDLAGEHVRLRLAVQAENDRLDQARQIVWTGHFADLAGATTAALVAFGGASDGLINPLLGYPLALLYVASVGGSVYKQRGPRWSLNGRLIDGEIRGPLQLMAHVASIGGPDADSGASSIDALVTFGWRFLLGGLSLPLQLLWTLVRGSREPVDEPSSA